VIAHKPCFGVSDHPVCAAAEASRYFLTGAATPPLEEGTTRRLTIHKVHAETSQRPLHKIRERPNKNRVAVQRRNTPEVVHTGFGGNFLVENIQLIQGLDVF
jgi:hypothetical protein